MFPLDALTEVEMAAEIGRRCYRLFPGDSWDACRQYMRNTWLSLEREMPWEQAEEHVRAGWQAEGALRDRRARKASG